MRKLPNEKLKQSIYTFTVPETTKTIQIEAKIRSTTQQHSSIIHVTANFALVRGSKPIP